MLAIDVQGFFRVPVLLFHILISQIAGQELLPDGRFGPSPEDPTRRGGKTLKALSVWPSVNDFLLMRGLPTEFFPLFTSSSKSLPRLWYDLLRDIAVWEACRMWDGRGPMTDILHIWGSDSLGHLKLYVLGARRQAIHGIMESSQNVSGTGMIVGF